MDTNTLQAKIEEISPALRRKIGFLKDANLTTDDLFQEAILVIMQRALNDATFLENKDAYIIQAGFWAAQHRCETSRVYTNHLYEETAIAGTALAAAQQVGGTTNSDEEEDGELIDMFCDPDLTPEASLQYGQAVSDLVEAVKKCSPTNQAIIRRLAAGESESEIAAALGITRPAVSQRKKTIAAQLARFADSTFAHYL